MILTALIAMAAAWSYDCPFIWQFRPDTSYKVFRQQEEMASIFQSQNHLLHDVIQAFKSSKHSCCPSSCFFEISRYRTCTNKRHEGRPNPQSREFKKGGQIYISSLDALFNTGKLTICAVRQMWQCYSVVCAWIADYFKNIHVYLI
jgi:hypothetical protein